MKKLRDLRDAAERLLFGATAEESVAMRMELMRLTARRVVDERLAQVFADEGDREDDTQQDDEPEGGAS